MSDDDSTNRARVPLWIGSFVAAAPSTATGEPGHGQGAAPVSHGTTRSASAGIQSFFPINAVFSPDGRWIAYTSGDQKGAVEIYVQPFPATGAKYQVSKDPRSHHPRWTPDGKEIYYIPGPSRSLAVGITTQPSFTVGNAVPLPELRSGGPSVVRNYDIAPDGRSLIVVPAEQASGQSAPSGATGTLQIQVVLNWFEELKAKAPTK